MASLQQNYEINPPFGFVGQIAEPNSPNRVEKGVLHLAAADPRGVAAQDGARPGDSVYYDQTNDGWRVARSAATQLLVGGILGYRQDDIASADGIVAFQDGDEIEVITMGVVWVVAGGASERGDIMVMQTDDWKYDNTARVTSVATMYETPIVNYSRDATADTNIVKVAIGYGRAL